MSSRRIKKWPLKEWPRWGRNSIASNDTATLFHQMRLFDQVLVKAFRMERLNARTLPASKRFTPPDAVSKRSIGKEPFEILGSRQYFRVSPAGPNEL